MEKKNKEEDIIIQLTNNLILNGNDLNKVKYMIQKYFVEFWGEDKESQIEKALDITSIHIIYPAFNSSLSIETWIKKLENNKGNLKEEQITQLESLANIFQNYSDKNKRSFEEQNKKSNFENYRKFVKISRELYDNTDIQKREELIANRMELAESTIIPDPIGRAQIRQFKMHEISPDLYSAIIEEYLSKNDKLPTSKTFEKINDKRYIILSLTASLHDLIHELIHSLINVGFSVPKDLNNESTGNEFNEIWVDYVADIIEKEINENGISFLQDGQSYTTSSYSRAFPGLKDFFDSNMSTLKNAYLSANPINKIEPILSPKNIKHLNADINKIIHLKTPTEEELKAFNNKLNKYLSEPTTKKNWCQKITDLVKNSATEFAGFCKTLPDIFRKAASSIYSMIRHSQNPPEIEIQKDDENDMDRN